jgi:hypothetical protein
VTRVAMMLAVGVAAGICAFVAWVETFPEDF